MSAPPLIYIILLNWNNAPAASACLASLAHLDYPHYRLLLVDNGSTDGSLQTLRRLHPDLTILPAGANHGYAGGNNLGIRWALSQGAAAVFLLNDDTLVDPACLTHLFAALDDHPHHGLAGPLVYHHARPDVVQSAGGGLDHYWRPYHLGRDEVDRGQFSRLRPVTWLAGCALLIRRAAIEQVGLFDERYFCYWEEVDYCLRARAAGWGVVRAPAARVWHAGGQADLPARPAITYYYARNRLLFLSAHCAPLPVWAYTFLQEFHTLLMWTARPRWRARRAYRDALWQALLDFFRRRWGPLPANYPWSHSFPPPAPPTSPNR